jgi:hypothetical protein
MTAFSDLYRLGMAAAVTVASVASEAGAAVSTSVFGTQTYAVAFSFPGSTSSTCGVCLKIVTPRVSQDCYSASSTADFLCPQIGWRKSNHSRSARIVDFK